MIEIPQEVKDALREGTYRKNWKFYILASNGDVDFIIDNNNLVTESVDLNDHLCSSDKIKFGLCEGSTLEFQYFDFPNITGRRLRAAIECEYKTLEGEYDWYEMSLGFYEVEYCARQMATGIMKAQCYNKLLSDYLDAKANKQIEEIVSKGDGEGGEATLGTIINSLRDGFGAETAGEPVSLKYDGYRMMQTREAYQSEYSAKWVLMNTETGEKSYAKISFNRSNAAVFGKYNYDPYVTGIRFEIKENDSEMVRARFTFEKLIEKVNALISAHLSKYRRYTEYDEEVTKTTGTMTSYRHTFTPKEDSLSSKSFAEEIFDGISCGIALSYTTPYSWEGGIDDKGVVIYSTDAFSVVLHNGTTVKANEDSSYKGDFKKFEALKSEGGGSAKFYVTFPTNIEIRSRTEWGAIEIDFHEVLREAIQELAETEMTVYEKRKDSEIEKTVYTAADVASWEDVTVRELQSAIFEMSAQFGRMNLDTDLFEGIRLNQDRLLPAEDLYPSDELYPISPAEHTNKSMYERLWADEGNVHKFHNLVITYKGTDDQEHTLQRVINSDGTDNYNMSDNWLFKHLKWDKGSVAQFAEEIVALLKDVTWFPFEMWATGLPYLMTGDEIEVSVGNRSYTTYILERQLKGIQLLRDTFINGNLDAF